MIKLINLTCILSLTFFIFSLFNFESAAYADSNCVSLYGGGQNCNQSINLSVSKMVLNPSTNTYVNNLGVNDPRYNPGQVVPFQITVTNTGNQTLNSVTVQDLFPQYVNFNAGTGSFDSNTKLLTWTINSLSPGQSQTFNISGQVVSANQMPNNGIICVVNQVTASDNEAQAQANAQFCIQESTTSSNQLTVFPVPSITKTPPTGPELFSLLSLFSAGLSGIVLRSKSR